MIPIHLCAMHNRPSPCELYQSVLRAARPAPATQAAVVARLKEAIEVWLSTFEPEIEHATDAANRLTAAYADLVPPSPEERLRFAALATAARDLTARLQDLKSRIDAPLAALREPIDTAIKSAKSSTAAADEAARSAIASIDEHALLALDAIGQSPILKASAPDPTAPVHIAIKSEFRIRCEITDPEAVPREFCIPSKTAIERAAQNNTPVPGTRSFRTVRVILPAASGRCHRKSA